MKELMVKTNNKGEELRINSVELVEIINQFREIESSTLGKEFKQLQHKDFQKKLRKELDVLSSLGLEGEGNISPSSYTNSQNKKQPCYSLNRDGMLQMLNSESTLVRFKTIEYINKLEEEVKPKLPTTYKEALLALVEAEEQKERLLLENKELEKDNNHKQDVIIGLVSEIDLAEKRQRIGQIVTYKTSKFPERYRLLYSEFDKKFHMNTKQRMNNAKDRGEIKKSMKQMGYICDVLNMTSELYDVACKVFCNDTAMLMKEMWSTIG